MCVNSSRKFVFRSKEGKVPRKPQVVFTIPKSVGAAAVVVVSKIRIKIKGVQ